MGISWLDGFLLLVVVAAILWEIRRDLGQSLFDTVALLLGLRLALWVGPAVSRHLTFATPVQARGLALLGVFLIGSAAAMVGGFYLNTITRWTLDTFDRVAGVLLGFSSAVIICHVLVVSLAFIYGTPTKPPAFVTGSRLGQEALSFQTFQQVIQFFDRLHT
jgi:uncharacterized membrane protein required for colicin V production